MFTNETEFVLGNAPVSLQAIRLLYPQAGYYRTIHWGWTDNPEISGPYNTLERAKNHPVFLGGIHFVSYKVQFLYTAPEGAIVPDVSGEFYDEGVK